MSRNVLRKMKLSVASRYGFSHSMLPVLHPAAGGRNIEVHAAHVEAAHLRFRRQRRCEPLVQRHRQAATGGDVHHGIDVLLDHRQEAHEHVRIGGRRAGFRIAGVQVDDRGTGLRRLDRAARNLFRRDRQIVRHAGRVDRAGHGTTDDHLAGHRVFPPSLRQARVCSRVARSARGRRDSSRRVAGACRQIRSAAPVRFAAAGPACRRQAGLPPPCRLATTVPA